MTRNSFTTRGLIQTTLAALILVGSVALTGCGTNMSTAPQGLSLSSDDGEVIVPGKESRVSTPAGFNAQVLSASTVELTWVPAPGHEALIDLDGVRIAQVSARNGNYLDAMAKSAGQHTYTICFQRGKDTSRGVIQTVEIMAPASEDGGRDNGRRSEGDK